MPEHPVRYIGYLTPLCEWSFVGLEFSGSIGTPVGDRCLLRTFKIIIWLAVSIALVAGTAEPAQALPRNTRQIAEGYWVGGAPNAADIEALHERGITLILSAVRVAPSVQAACDRLDIRRVAVRFGSTFRVGRRVLEATNGVDPSEIFIHCTHGGDRAGSILAYLLAVRHGWPADHAILAVAFPGHNDLRRLIELMEGEGLEITPEESAEFAGVYSGASNGGHGGLKVRGESYVNLVNTLLEAMVVQGVELQDEVGQNPEP